MNRNIIASLLVVFVVISCNTSGGGSTPDVNMGSPDIPVVENPTNDSSSQQVNNPNEILREVKKELVVDKKYEISNEEKENLLDQELLTESEIQELESIL